MKTVYILGAGADVPLGLPMANRLLAELGAFAKGEGKKASQILRKKLGRFQFGFEKYAADQGEGFAESVLGNGELGARLKSALQKTPESESVTAVIQVLDKLEAIRTANLLDETTSGAIAKLAGEDEEMADHTLLRLRGVGLNPVPRSAMLNIFRGAQATESLLDEEKEALDSVVAIMTNFEELLTDLFAGFYTGNVSAQRKYLYVAWLLWVYMRWKSFSGQEKVGAEPSFYDQIPALADQDWVVTFNYTDIGALPAERTIRFHGDCLSYIRYDRGEIVPNDDVRNATDLEALETFIDSLDIDVGAGKIFLPAVVPPSAMKPVITSHFIERWESCRHVLTDAELLVVIGYSFNPVDRHFNDLFRRASPGKRVAIINPDLEGLRSLACSLLGMAPEALSATNFAGFEASRSDQLLVVRAGSQEISTEFLEKLLHGWQV